MQSLGQGKYAHIHPLAYCITWLIIELRHLKWSFGKTLLKSELQFGYIMKACWWFMATYINSFQVVNFPKTPETYLEWYV